MHPVPKSHRGHVAAAPVNLFLDAPSRDSSPNGNAREQLRLCPPPAADNHRELSPEPLSYTAYRPREFLS